MCVRAPLCGCGMVWIGFTVKKKLELEGGWLDAIKDSEN